MATIKSIAACKPCGCVSIINVIESDSGYKATPADLADFYRDVHKATTRKRNPLVLDVKEIIGRDFKMGCAVCRPKSSPVLF